MPTPVLDKIHAYLQGKNIVFRALHHEPTPTSEDSARARGEDIKIGGKALVLKVDDQFKLFVISAALKIDSKKLSRFFGAKKIRFATKEELLELTGLQPGSVPPFGQPILPLELYVDTSIVTNERIAFNAGSVTDSVIMSVVDYLEIAAPQNIFSFAETT